MDQDIYYFDLKTKKKSIGKNLLDMVAHFILALRRQRKAELCGFQTSLVYTVRSSIINK